jgi:nucleotide-binding universal stress UspA family protein
MDGAQALFDTAREVDGNRVRLARERFEAAAPGPRMRWAELVDNSVIPGFAREALGADLLVLGQHDPNDPEGQAVPADFVESVIVDSGRPAIVVPYAGEFADFGRNVLVAWKATRESARAVAAAMPFLEAAKTVHVSSWDGTEPHQIDVLLRSHGIDARFHREGRAGADIGEYLLSRAAELGADLLVMGCYGHSRARELVLGGASRSVLDAMTLPVLMVH